MRRRSSDVNDEFYSDSVEVAGQGVGSEESEEDGIEECSEEVIFNSNKRFRKIESSQESFTQNSQFNHLSNEIEDINSRIESISNSIENIMMNSGGITSPVCILEQIPGNGSNGSKKRLSVQIGSGGLKIGRSRDCGFPGKLIPKKNLLKLSRNHAYIYVKKNSQGKNQAHIVDCNSMNGTYVNNVKIRNKILESDDILSFGCKDVGEFESEARLSTIGARSSPDNEHECRFKVVLCDN
ncbi:forkhead associated domain (FHA) containing protein [Cryptosporidium canis]|uniref:Forkhead associated domain (FHA) containing protein n=1 Tax=Cryptosporidium canis TaxID=195482 RepID=A0A9D5DHZ3_9CRYT|nr:forkhead associated domain (FHA) containing protein [Cryptosporidium canis]